MSDFVGYPQRQVVFFLGGGGGGGFALMYKFGNLTNNRTLSTASGHGGKTFLRACGMMGLTIDLLSHRGFRFDT